MNHRNTTTGAVAALTGSGTSGHASTLVCAWLCRGIAIRIRNSIQRVRGEVIEQQCIEQGGAPRCCLLPDHGSLAARAPLTNHGRLHVRLRARAVQDRHGGCTCPVCVDVQGTFPLWQGKGMLGTQQPLAVRATITHTHTIPTIQYREREGSYTRFHINTPYSRTQGTVHVYEHHFHRGNFGRASSLKEPEIRVEV